MIQQTPPGGKKSTPSHGKVGNVEENRGNILKFGRKNVSIYIYAYYRLININYTVCRGVFPSCPNLRPIR